MYLPFGALAGVSLALGQVWMVIGTSLELYINLHRRFLICILMVVLTIGEKVGALPHGTAFGRIVNILNDCIIE